MTTGRQFQDYARQGNDEEFARVQTQMVENWVAGLKAKGVDLEQYYQQRHRAYDIRWREALAYVAKPSDILDIGGGNLHESLLKTIAEAGHRYRELDIDPVVVESNRNKGVQVGIPSENFQRGENTHLPYPDASFDLVFSSHCLEHSLDLPTTFAEIRRVLRPDGLLFFAVPIGWDEAIEHLYFLDESDWLSIVQRSGFRVRGTHIGDFYPEDGHDLAVIAVRDAEPGSRPEIDSFRKARYTVRPHEDPSLRLLGNWQYKEDHAIALDSTCELVWEGNASEVLLLLRSHDWSGIAEVTDSRGQRFEVDLYSWYPRMRGVRVLPPLSSSHFRSQPGWDLHLPPPDVRTYAQMAWQGARQYLHRRTAPQGVGAADWVRVRPIGRNPASQGSQIVLYGVLTR